MTIEQCKKLKEWGLPQDNVSGCFWVHKSAGVSLVYNSTQCSDYVGTGDEILFAHPDLEELLEFARKKLRLVELRSLPPKLRQPQEEWCAWTTRGWIGITASDSDPKVAVYKLLEKILGEATP